jgi:hypothetical protein
MNAKPTLARPRVVTTIAAAALSSVIAIGLLTAGTGRRPLGHRGRRRRGTSKLLHPVVQRLALVDDVNSE